MHHINIKNYEEWRESAREYLHAEIPPNQIIWKDISMAQSDLFETIVSKKPGDVQHHKYRISKQFFKLAEIVSCYRENEKWSLLYEALWRIAHQGKNLLYISSDPLVCKLNSIEKSIQRDIYKMKAFVRFREYRQGNQNYYVAWYQPDHLILRQVAIFFQQRFSSMHWTVVTPDETVCWDGQNLQFLPGIENFKHRQDDKFEDLWRTYYGAIFNPARLKIKTMHREMPARYWKNLPETFIIYEMLQKAPARVAKMLQHSEGVSSTARDYFPENLNYLSLKKAASACKACPLHHCSKQTVFGGGNEKADILIVAEQPGPQEDEADLPIVGFSGEFIKNILGKFSIDLDSIYLTNAVKHLKCRVSAGEIIYQNPTIQEIYACKPWLEAEINLIKPKVILSLGLIAAKSLLSPGFHLKEQRKKIHSYKNIPIIATYHPSTILKYKNPETDIEMTSWISDDIVKAIKMII